MSEEQKYFNDILTLREIIGKYEAGTEYNTKEIAIITNKLSDLEKSLVTVTTHISELDRRITESEHKDAYIENDLTKLKTQFVKIDEKLQNIIRKVEDLQIETKNYVNGQNNHMSDIDKDIIRTHSEENKIVNNIDELKKDIADMETTASNLQSEFNTRLIKLEDKDKLWSGIKNILLALLGVIATVLGIVEVASKIFK